MAKYEYMLKYWGGSQRKVDAAIGAPDAGDEPTYLFFDTREERDAMKRRVHRIAQDGLATVCEEGDTIRNRLYVEVETLYKKQKHLFIYGFGCGYDEESASFTFLEGNYSCNCNLSAFIQAVDPTFPDVDCMDEPEIEITSLRMRQITPEDHASFLRANEAFIIR